MIDEQMAQASNVLIYSAMLVYTGALAGFAIDLSGQGRAARTPAARRQEPAVRRELVTAGGDAGAPSRAHRVDPARRAPDGEPPARAAGRPASPSRSPGWRSALHLGGVVARGLSAHRAPWGNMYEFTISGAVVITGVFLLAADPPRTCATWAPSSSARCC